MAAPSAPLLELLRDLMRRRSLNTSSLAELTQLPRRRLRRILDGSEPMLVDEFVTLSQALQVSPEDLGLSAGPVDESAEEEVPDLHVVGDREREPVVITEWGNQPEQLVRAAFELGCDVVFTVDTEALADSGVPRQVLEAYQGRDLVVKLDAAYHQYNRPRYDQEGVTLTLSFDALYECMFPWHAFRQIIFTPVPPEPVEPDAPDEDPAGSPFLRLV